jgi:hypothetical protein
MVRVLRKCSRLMTGSLFSLVSSCFNFFWKRKLLGNWIINDMQRHLTNFFANSKMTCSAGWHSYVRHIVPYVRKVQRCSMSSIFSHMSAILSHMSAIYLSIYFHFFICPTQIPICLPYTMCPVDTATAGSWAGVGLVN